jgi:hypothetical protein
LPRSTRSQPQSSEHLYGLRAIVPQPISRCLDVFMVY